MKARELCTLHVVTNGWLVTVQNGVGMEKTFICKEWDEVLRYIKDSAWTPMEERIKP